MTTTVARPAALRPRPQVCRACGTLYDPAPVAICEQCLGPLDPVVDAARVLPTRDAIAARPWSLWRYREWLPFDGEPVLSLDTGGTPLVEAPRLAALLGVAHVWVKNDAVSHPSLSFKDRVVATAINAAAAFGLDTIGCASTGNLANAVAAQAARAGLKAWIFIPEDLEAAKSVGTAVDGAAHGRRARDLRRAGGGVRTDGGAGARECGWGDTGDPSHDCSFDRDGKSRRWVVRQACNSRVGRLGRCGLGCRVGGGNPAAGRSGRDLHRDGRRRHGRRRPGAGGRGPVFSG